MDETEVARTYVEFSNSGDLDAIAQLLELEATYSSKHTGLYYGKASIMRMMVDFFAKYTERSWEVLEYRKVKDGIVEFDFEFSGIDIEGEEVQRSGKELIVVSRAGLIRHVEVR